MRSTPTEFFYVWQDKNGEFVQTHYTNVVCDECGERYNDEEFVWDKNHGSPGEEMLVCPCGQQFYQNPD